MSVCVMVCRTRRLPSAICGLRWARCVERGLLQAFLVRVKACEFLDHAAAQFFKLRPVFAGDGAGGRKLERQEIPELAMLLDPKIEMRAGCEAGAAAECDGLPLVNALAAVDQDARQVKVESLISHGVTDLDFAAAAPVPTGKNHGSVAYGLHLGANRYSKVDAKVRPVTLEDGMKTMIAETGGNGRGKPQG